MAPNGLQNLSAFRSKQSQEHIYSMNVCFLKCGRDYDLDGGKENRQTAVEHIDDNCAYSYRVIMQTKNLFKGRFFRRHLLSENTKHCL